MKFTRHGFWEMLIGTIALLAVAAGLGLAVTPWLALLAVPVLIWLFAFFRDPERPLPAHAEGTVGYVSPADGRVSDVIEIEDDPVLHEPTVRIGIFLSVFNVHVNRSPCDGVVRETRYKKGKFVNAMSHGTASEHNESNTVVLEDAAGDPVAVVKQIVGLIARRIVLHGGGGRPRGPRRADRHDQVRQPHGADDPRPPGPARARRAGPKGPPAART